jgi:hypothetical protein
MYLVGGSKSRTGYRFLEIDRTVQDILSVREDPREYSYAECTARIGELEKRHAYDGGLVRTGRYAALMGTSCVSMTPRQCCH